MIAALVIGPGDFKLFLAISVLTGIGLGADYGLPPSILADVINSEEGGDTKGKTDTYFGLWALSTKLATAIGAAFSLPVVAMLGFNPEKGQYSTTALIIVYIALPVAIKTVAGLLIWFVCVRMDLEKDAAVGSGWAPELIARQYEARERMSAQERQSWRHEQSLGLQSLRFFKHLGVGLTLIGGAGFLWFQL